MWPCLKRLFATPKEKKPVDVAPYLSILPNKYKWLASEDAPRVLLEALSLFGTKEISGEEHNPVILSWADEVGGWISNWYDNDEIPWCGLFVAVVVKRAGFPFTQKALAALEWKNWGKRSDEASLGDVLVFKRSGGGHVGFYVGEDKECYHVLGGNQSDQVNITRIKKARLAGVRRCPWRNQKPHGVRPIHLEASGQVSVNEA